MAVAQELEESLDIGYRRIRRAAQGHNLPEENAERPDVRLASVDALKQSFWRHPLDRQAAISRLAIILVHVHVAGQTKIGNLQNTIFADQHVSGGQIAVNTLQKTSVGNTAISYNFSCQTASATTDHTFFDSR